MPERGLYGLCRRIAADFVPLPRPPPLQNLDLNPETLDPEPEVHEVQTGEGRTSTGLRLVNVIFTELIYCAGSTVTRTFSVPITVKLKARFYVKRNFSNYRAER